MLDKIVHTLITPKNLARLTVAWVLVTVLLASANTATPKIYASAKKKADTANQAIEVKVDSNTTSQSIAKTSNPKKELTEFEALLEFIGEEIVKQNTNQPTKGDGELPIKLEIPSRKISTVVLNPNTTDIKVLDKELDKGAVRYPTSGLLGEKNKAVIIFGHTSYVPGFFGSYRTFNGVDKLNPGEEVIVYSDSKKYVYRVSNRQKVSADAEISLKTNNNKLILITCDGFGSKNIRYKVEADLVRVENIK